MYRHNADHTTHLGTIDSARPALIPHLSGHSPSLPVQILLALTRHPSLHVATLSMEFWEAFREVPMAKRAPALGPPLCVRMLDVLADRLSYPSNFTSWDKEVAIDEEDFARCLAYPRGFRNRYRLCLRQQPLSSSDFYPPLNLIVGVGRFRENDLARDMLESCYMAMRVHFFLHLGQRMDAAPDVWQVNLFVCIYTTNQLFATVVPHQTSELQLPWP